MLDYIDEEYITVNFRNYEENLPIWFVHAVKKIIRYYSLESFSIHQIMYDNAALLEEYFRKHGLEFEMYEVRKSDSRQCGCVFKVNDALTLFMLKGSK
jgi:hypothetical protein